MMTGNTETPEHFSVHQQEHTYSDNGGAIPWNFSTGWFILKDPNARKKVDSIYAHINKLSNYDIQSDVFLNYLGSASISNQDMESKNILGAQWDVDSWDVGSFSDEDVSLEHYLKVNRITKSARVNFRHNVAGEPGKIQRCGVYQRQLELTAQVS